MLTPEENEMMALSEVARYMVRDVKSVTAESNLQEASRLMAQFGIGSLLVKKADQLVGILTETDMARKGMATDVNPQKTSVESLMSAPIITIEGYKTVAQRSRALLRERLSDDRVRLTRSSGYRRDGLLQDLHHLPQFLQGGAERRHEDDDVPKRADEHAEPPSFFRHAVADALR